MKRCPIPENEIERLKVLEEYSIMDSLPEKEYDSITELASYICGTPIAFLSFIDEQRQWFKSSIGLGVTEIQRDISFCQYAIMGDDVYEVNNASDHEIFANNPLVIGNPNIRFYVGAPLQDVNGFNLGTLCVAGTESKILTDEQKKSLQLLADQVVLLVESRKKNEDLLKTQKELQNFIDLSIDLVCIAGINGMFYKVNPAFTNVLGYSKEEIEGSSFLDLIHPDDMDITLNEVKKLSEGKTTISFENRYRCKNGEYVTLSWNTSPDPETGFSYSIARDMTLEKQQQEKLLDTTNNLKAILDSSELSIIATGLDGTIKQFNKGSELLLGYKAEEVVGKYTPALIHVQDEIVKRAEDLTIQFGKKVEPEFNAIIGITKKNGTAESKEWTYVRKDGSTFSVMLSITSIKNNLGEVTGYLGIAKDVTKEKETELNLIKSNDLLDESQSITKIGSWKFDLITKDLFWSKGLYMVFDLEELPSDQLFNAYRSRIHPDDLPNLDIAIEKTVTTGADFYYNYRILFPNGNLKYVEGRGKPYKNEKGEVTGILGTVQDITEKTLDEQKIVNKTKEIRDIKLALDESVSVEIIDKKGIITYVNDKFCDISKFSKTELIGQSHHVVNSGYHSKEFIRNIWVIIANGNIWRGEMKNKAKDGSFYWVYTTIVPFLNENGKPYQYIFIRSNITERKLAQENLNTALLILEKKNKELDQYAYVVSHDLKAPLRAINNLSEWIVEDMPEMPEAVSHNFELLRGRIQRMENLINGVLEYSRIGRTQIEKETTDVKKMLNQIVDFIVPLEGFEVSIADDMPVIETEKILLEQVFSNLISNSVKYNDKQIGKIECFYKSVPNFHQFTVKDNGPGIAKEYHKKVFEVFQTIEARDTKESTGIGLSIVKKVIEEKGGSIYIESENDNGASFIFTIPK